VIKILKDICMECPEFPKIPEICVKMIRRVNDEEGMLLIYVLFIVNRV
jgi:cohesin loading factor subunit SCC2